MTALRSSLAQPRLRVDEVAEVRYGARRTLAVGCVLGAMAMVVHSAAVTSVALPALAECFATTPRDAVSVVTAYQLAVAVALLPCAALGERFVLRRVFAAGSLLFTAASLACSHAPSLDTLAAARFVQGLGAAAVMALGVALLRAVLPAHRITAAIGWNALTVALSTAAGPAAGAWLLAHASPPWLFALHVPLGVAVVLATRALPRAAGRRTAVPSRGLIANVVPLDLLQSGPFRRVMLASIACFAGQSAAMVALPFHLQRGLGEAATRVGWFITVWPLSVACVAPIAGRLADRVPATRLCAAGAVFLAVGLGAAALATSAASIVPCLALAGAGFGLFQVPNNRTLLLAAPPARSAAAGALQGTARLVGQTLGAALLGVMFSVMAASTASRAGLALGAVLALTSGFVSATRAETTPVQPEPDTTALTRRRSES